MISVHKTIVEIQNLEKISVCGLGCSINFWVHVRYNEDFLLPRSPSYSQTWVIWHLSINPCADSNSDHWNTFKHVSMHSKTFLRGCISTLYTLKSLSQELRVSFKMIFYIISFVSILITIMWIYFYYITLHF